MSAAVKLATKRTFRVRTLAGVEMGEHLAWTPREAVEMAWESFQDDRARLNTYGGDYPRNDIPWGRISAFPVS